MTDDVDIEAMLEAPFKQDPDISDRGGNKMIDMENDDKTSKAASRDERRREREERERGGGGREGSRSRSGSRSKAKRSRSRSKGKRSNRSRSRSPGGRGKRRSRSRDNRRRSGVASPPVGGGRRSGSRDRRSSPPRDRNRSPRRRDRSRDNRRERFGGGGRSPPRRRSPSPHGISRGGPGSRKLPGPERRDVMPFTPRYSPPRDAPEGELSPEDRDARTVFVMQLSQRIRPRDLEEFFSSVGKVRDVRIITDSKTRRSKGIAYIEFWDMASVPLALGLAGQRLLGIPIIVQPTQSEKNRMASAMLATTFQQNRGPLKLYVGSLHFNITEDMLRGIFEPFGKIDSIQLLRDPETNRSRGYGFITFHSTEDAKRAMEQLNGFELAGRAMKVGNVTEHQPNAGGGQSNLDTDELDRTGIDLGTTGRLQLMAKLAEGTGMQLPTSAQQVLDMQQQQQQQQSGSGSAQTQQQQQQQQQAPAPPIATQCFMLSNMFDPAQEVGEAWDQDIKDDVVEECNKHGSVLHIFVDKASPQGNVYVKCSSIATACASVNALHGRWYSGRIITANYVPVPNYHQLFPDAMR